jgi:hypothetical protein
MVDTLPLGMWVCLMNLWLLVRLEVYDLAQFTVVKHTSRTVACSCVVHTSCMVSIDLADPRRAGVPDVLPHLLGN